MQERWHKTYKRSRQALQKQRLANAAAGSIEPEFHRTRKRKSSRRRHGRLSGSQSTPNLVPKTKLALHRQRIQQRIAHQKKLRRMHFSRYVRLSVSMLTRG